MALNGPSIWIKTRYFKPEPGEQQATNPGRSGHALARWLADQFALLGEPVQGCDPDDWGWRVTLAEKPFRIYLACGMRLDQVDEWAASVFAEEGVLQRLFRHTDMKPEVKRLHALLYSIMQQAPEVERIWLEDEPDWMS